MQHVLAGALSGAVAAIVTRSTAHLRAFDRHRALWTRQSFRGTPVSLQEGVGVAAGLGASALTLSQMRLPMLVAVGSSAGAGYVDDHLEERFPAQGKGLHGHLGALAHGKLTSGVIKIVVIGLGALVAAAQMDDEPAHESHSAHFLRVLCRAGIIAGSANLVNLVDLRPGRALKVSAAMSSIGALVDSRGALHHESARIACALVASCLAVAREDLQGQSMLGDLGANALGAAWGIQWAASRSRPVRAATLAAIGTLTLASEKISFSRVIDASPLLSRIDRWGTVGTDGKAE
ncbi:MAG: hypothetical protein SPI12_05220 [Actinomycetaceae bacterium]|nr:hypothetical protein [Actinomycetaceae bacterium]MDY6083244.1 hypothetical protein [Actinomycetaceae bacterium]